MEKTIVIRCCDQCEDWDEDLFRCKPEDRENEDTDLAIPDWCPIED